MSSSNQIVGANTSLQVSFVTRNHIPIGGYLTLQIPKWNPQAVTNVVSMLSTPFTVTAGTNLNQTGLTTTFVSDVLTIKQAITT